MDQDVSRTINGTENNDTLSGDDGNEQFFGLGGNDQIDGRGGNDLLTGGAGNDQLLGGAGMDTAIYAGAFSDYLLSYRAGVLGVQDTVLTNGDEGLDSLRDVEVLQFADRTVTLPDPLRYLASNADLIRALGADTTAAMNHYLSVGVAQGRVVDGFDVGLYLAKHGDLRVAFNGDHGRALRHYVETGFGEGRSLNLNGDDVLVGTAGDDVLNGGGGFDMITGGGGNDQLTGGNQSDIAQYAGKLSDFRLSYRAGVITVQDMVTGNGDEGTDTLREFASLFFADAHIPLPTPLRYHASNPDLLNAFGGDTDAVMNHFLVLGRTEIRQKNVFRPDVYLAKYADLRAVFGHDDEGALAHYVQYGFAEGRSDSVAGDDMLLGSSIRDQINGGTGNDSLTGGGDNDFLIGGPGFDTAVYAGLFGQYQLSHRNGFTNVRDTSSLPGNEGSDEMYEIEVLQFADRAVTLPNPLRYLASNSDLIKTFGLNADAALNHYLSTGLAQGRSTTSFDPALYLAKYVDVRAAYGNTDAAAIRHYVQYGFAEGRTIEPADDAPLVGVSPPTPFV